MNAIVRANQGWLVPRSCRRLNLGKVEEALILSYGNIAIAARRLGIPSTDLRSMVRAIPWIMDAALEGVERVLDQAEAVVIEGLSREDYRERLAAASIVLRGTKAAEKRGWAK